MSDSRKHPEEAEEASTFFNRGKSCNAEIVRDNEQLRLKIRRLEQALRRVADPVRRPPRDGSADER
jgi:tRNA/tmRNA/rRNA uracil-C5-methylase (TrmA/RlmC/RlmD family)